LNLEIHFAFFHFLWGKMSSLFLSKGFGFLLCHFFGFFNGFLFSFFLSLSFGCFCLNFDLSLVGIIVVSSLGLEFELRFDFGLFILLGFVFSFLFSLSLCLLFNLSLCLLFNLSLCLLYSLILDIHLSLSLDLVFFLSLDLNLLISLGLCKSMHLRCLKSISFCLCSRFSLKLFLRIFFPGHFVSILKIFLYSLGIVSNLLFLLFLNHFHVLVVLSFKSGFLKGNLLFLFQESGLLLFHCLLMGGLLGSNFLGLSLLSSFLLGFFLGLFKVIFLDSGLLSSLLGLLSYLQGFLFFSNSFFLSFYEYDVILFIFGHSR
jgi:hypothetical protein